MIEIPYAAVERAPSAPSFFSLFLPPRLPYFFSLLPLAENSIMDENGKYISLPLPSLRSKSKM
jgi:hypothetical protein